MRDRATPYRALTRAVTRGSHEHARKPAVFKSMRLAIAALVMLASQHAYAADRCVGDYAEDLSALSPGARELEARAPNYSYAVRTTATYECVSYGADTNLKTCLLYTSDAADDE